MTVTPSARSKTSIRQRDRGRAPSRAVGDSRQRAARSPARRRPPASGVADLVAADERQRDRRASAGRVTSVNDARPGRRAPTSLGAHVGVRRLADSHHPRRGAARHRPHQRVVGVEHRDARPAGSASTSSPFACAMASTEPNSPMCAMPTLSTTPIRGGATWQR